AARSSGSSLVKGNMKLVAFSFKWFFSDYSDEWYKSIFAPFKGLKGEITPSYSMLSKEDISRMYAMAPTAKLVLMLRDPIDR
ncbi:hypothetical protein, partial [Flagellimonas flava]|uniref:hypothetical protein n=1 Tax=Flagellimonas flava TaxID=570519 RepID=UPI003D653E5B